MFSSIQHDTKELNDTYKILAIIKCAINHFKINMRTATSRTRNLITKSDVLFQFKNELKYIPFHALFMEELSIGIDKIIY